MNYNKVLFIYNGNAGNKEINQMLTVCLPALAEKVDSLLVYKSLRPMHAKELCEKYGEKVDLVIVLGGDGTVHECINGLAGLRNKPTFAILPGGTCNDFTRSLTLSQNLQEAVEEIIQGKEESVDVIQVNDGYFLNFWGLGLIAETANNIDKDEKNKFGRASYFMSALRTIQNQDPIETVINLDGREMKEEIVMLLVANGHYIGTKRIPFSSVKWNDGLLDLFIIRNANFRLIKEMIDLRREDEDEAFKDEILHLQGRELTISTKQPVDVDMDGEVYTKTPSTIKVLPEHIRMIVPSDINKE